MTYITNHARTHTHSHTHLHHIVHLHSLISRVPTITIGPSGSLQREQHPTQKQKNRCVSVFMCQYGSTFKHERIYVSDRTESVNELNSRCLCHDWTNFRVYVRPLGSRAGGVRPRRRASMILSPNGIRSLTP